MFMKICGLQKTTLLDFPGHVAATVFLGGCGLRCPFCHNSDLISMDTPALMEPEELLSFLKKRRSVLDGVCITGGEPTLFPEDLERLLDSIKSLGLLTQLDTNGFRPGVRRRLCAAGLIDYAAMDIKAGRSNYPSACGVPSLSIEPAEESVRLLMEGSVDYEFRTTAVKGIHSVSDFVDIRSWIGGCRRYFLQNFQDSGRVAQPGFQPFLPSELKTFLDVVRETIPQAQIRGTDLDPRDF